MNDCTMVEERMVQWWDGGADLSMYKNNKGRRRKQEDNSNIDLFILPCLV